MKFYTNSHDFNKLNYWNDITFKPRHLMLIENEVIDLQYWNVSVVIRVQKSISDLRCCPGLHHT